jgi:D-ornithine 4,5-aminomutase subunit beta
MTAHQPLDPNKKMDIEAILADLEHYRPIRKGWVWRKVMEEGIQMGPFHFRNMSEPLKKGIGLPASKYFDDIDPQPECVVTTEIASGRFEDDLRRMRMAAWHGADHLMVIRTTGQSHIDGLMEGTPEGVGGVPITRKQLRASRKACDLIEEEVGGRSISIAMFRVWLGQKWPCCLQKKASTARTRTPNTMCCTATSICTAPLSMLLKPSTS